jgi:ATP-dependent Clp endopeptidase proteolytic subunit ClpP
MLSSIEPSLGSSLSSNGSIIVCEKNNTIHFNTEISARTMSDLIDKLHLLEKTVTVRQRKMKRTLSDLLDNDKNTDCLDSVEVVVSPKPITLYITSNGGLIYQAFSAIDTIKSLKVPVHTVCKGFVASAGTLLSLAGKKRYITSNSYMLIHELRSGTWGKHSQMVEDLDNSRALMEHIRSYYVKHTKITAAELDEQLKRDICWNAETCLEKGLVDEII